MSSRSNVRNRAVAGAIDLIRRRGATGASIRDLAQHAGVPLGSTYHYFPGGKQQLVTEAVEFSGRYVEDQLRLALDTGPVDGLLAFIATYRLVLIQSDFRAGCPILAVAIEESDGQDTVVRAAASAFTSWEGLFEASLRVHGVPATAARDFAALAVASVEGAVAMCRAKHSIDTLDAVTRRLQTSTQELIDGSS
jgi:AcrR family transcriptional regulator